MYRTITAGILTISCIGWSPTIAANTAPKPISSATESREIGGFVLGMSLREASALAKIEPVGGYQFETQTDGLQFNFEVTPLGRIYRITSRQRLGRFAEDQAFRSTLLSKLTAKYGPPGSVEGGTVQWELIEAIRDMNGATNPFRTMWMTANISDDDGEKALEITMIDFRVLWADQSRANQAGRAAAENQVKF